MAATWRNWAGNQSSEPLSIDEPRDAEELCQMVAQAAAAGQTVKIPGSGHSFTGAAATNGRMIRVNRLSGLHSVDRTQMVARVGAGTTLSELNALLHAEGLAMPNLGDIAYQTVAGAVSTSTHGTGARLPGLAGQIAGFKMVSASGEMVTCDAQTNAEIFDVGRVSVGALGAVTEYSLKVVEAFRLRAHEEPMRIDRVLDEIDEHVSTNDHFEFFWIPHTKWALTKRNNRTQDDLAPLPRFRGWFDKTFMENFAFGALCHVGRMRPALIPRLATALPSSGSREYVDHSHKIFASPRLVRFYEMEHSIPSEAVVPALGDVMEMIERKGYLLNFPVEVRFTAPDDIPLSTAYGRASAYIAVHVFKGMRYEPFFRDVEDIMRHYQSRPHWGKIHHRSRDELATLYPRFDDFLSVRDRLDPSRVFANDYTRTVFGD